MQILRNKNKATTIALILALTIAATLITTLPVTFGQIKINMTADVWQELDPMGLGQTTLIQGITYPPPGYTISHTYTITKPDGTTETIVKDTFDPIGGMESNFEYTCDQLGEWEVELYWAGDELHEDDDATTSWIVQAEPVEPLKKIAVQAHACTVPKDVVGRGQTVFILGWINPPRELSGSLFFDLTFTITKPDGTTETKPIRNTDSPATCNTVIVCDQIGTWSVELSYGGDVLHEGAVSKTWTWTVQEEAVPAIPQQPLPDYPWEYPISGEYREWYQISGAWGFQDSGVTTKGFDASGSAFNPYSKAPTSPHILWKLQTDKSGIIGGEDGSLIWGGLRAEPIAAQGRLYFTRTKRWVTSDGIGSTHPVLVCVDQFTGEQIYAVDLPGRGNGDVLALEMSARAGEVDPKLAAREGTAFSLWVLGGGIWEIDPWTGAILYYWDFGVTGTYSTPAVYADGYLYFRGFNGTSGETESGTLTKWDCRNKETIWTIKGDMDNVWGGMLIDRQASTGMIPHGNKIVVWNATTGELIVDGAWHDFYCPAGGSTVGYGKSIRLSSTDLRVHAISLYTGEEVWTSDPPTEAPWGVYGMYWAAAAYDKFFVGTYDGYLYAINESTGKVEWKFYCGSTTETAAGVNVPWGGCAIADGKVYISTTEHSPPNPPPRGNMIFCLDANTGNLIWKLDSFSGRKTSNGISSGMYWNVNEYDSCLYMFGKGPTATTVSVSDGVIAKGESVLIQGTVTDQSTGAKDTPAISDADMNEWMQYMYMQKPIPTDANGVPVMLQAMRSDGSIIDLGWATSDLMGNYEYLWTPPDEDTYKVLATFIGSESYWMSSAGTALGVTAAPSPGGPIEPEPTAGLGITEIAIIAAVVVAVIIGVAAFWALRKQRK